MSLLKIAQYIEQKYLSKTPLFEPTKGSSMFSLRVGEDFGSLASDIAEKIYKENPNIDNSTKYQMVLKQVLKILNNRIH